MAIRVFQRLSKAKSCQKNWISSMHTDLLEMLTRNHPAEHIQAPHDHPPSWPFDRVAAMSQPLTRSGVRQWSTGVWFPIALRVELVQKGVSGRGGSCLSPLYFTSSSDMVIFRPWWTNKCLLLLEYQIGTGFQAGLIQWIVFLKCMDHKKKNLWYVFPLIQTWVYGSIPISQPWFWGNEEVPQNALGCLQYFFPGPSTGVFSSFWRNCF